MDFSLTEEQSLLRDSAERFLRERYDFETRRALAQSPDGYSQDNWRTFAEMGWLALPFSEDTGGLGGSQVDVMVLMEALGRGLVLEPYLGSILLAGRLVERLGNDSQRSAWLAPTIAGERRLAFAWAEPDARYDLADTGMDAQADGAGGYHLSGRKSVVLGAPGADAFVVLARTSGARGDWEGLTCFILPADADGLTIQPYRTIDGGRAADLTFEKVHVGTDAVLGPPDVAIEMVDALLDAATAALCGEALGLMQASLDSTRAYLQQRQQFGRPLAGFQVLQHRLADMTIALEECRSLTYVANIRVDDGDPVDRRRAVSTAKAELERHASFIAAQAVQLHGGMGVSEEMAVGACFKRLHAILRLFGDRTWHLRRFATLSAETAGNAAGA